GATITMRVVPRRRQGTSRARQAARPTPCSRIASCNAVFAIPSAESGTFPLRPLPWMAQGAAPRRQLHGQCGFEGSLGAQQRLVSTLAFGDRLRQVAERSGEAAIGTGGQSCRISTHPNLTPGQTAF